MVPTFKNKIILIGHYKDSHAYPNMGYKKFSSVFAHSYAIENILYNTPLIKIPVYVTSIFLFCFCLVQLLIYEFFGKRINSLLLLFMNLLLLTGIFYIQLLLQENYHLWINFSSFFVAASLQTGFYTLFRKIIITRKIRQINNYKKMIAEYDYQKHIFSDLISERAYQITSCINSIKNDFHVESRLQKYFALTLETCTDIIHTSSIMNETTPVNIEKIDSRDIKNEFCPYFKYSNVSKKNINIDIINFKDDFFIYSDKVLFRKLLKTIFENVLNAIGKDSTLAIHFSTRGKNRLITFFYTGQNISGNNPYFHSEIMEKNGCTIILNNGKKKKSLKLSFFNTK